MSAGKKAGEFAVWGILALLILGLGGFGVANFSGNVQSIGKVGDTPVSVNTYFRTLQQTLNATQAQFGTRLSLPQAEAFGIVAQAREQVIADATIDNAATDLGLSVGDAEVRRQILATPAFTGLDGSFDREGYRFTLEQSGLTEREFEANLRADATRGILQGAIVAGLTAPTSFGEALMAYAGEQRSFSTVTLQASDLSAPIGAPGDAALQTYYEANPDAFTLPQQRQITYVWLTPDMIVDTMQVDEDALRDAYDSRADIYQRAERRLVERLVFPDQASADAARAALDDGSSDFEALVSARGLSLSDIDLGDVTAASLGGDAGTAVFALSEPGVVGPVDTDLGPALLRMNAVLAAQNTSFDEARAELQAELARDAAARAIGDQVTDFDDLLAAGATLEELAADTDMQLGQIAYSDGLGDGIAGYATFRAAATAAQTGDFPELGDLSDGGVFALRLDEITPPALQPLTEMRDQAIALWQAAETRAALVAQAETMAATLAQGTPLAELGATIAEVSDLTRDAVQPPALAQAVFGLGAAGDATVIEDGDTAVLVTLDAIQAADMGDAQVVLQSTFINTQLSQSMAEDIYRQLNQALLTEAGLELDHGAIAAVHAQFHQ